MAAAETASKSVTGKAAYSFGRALGSGRFGLVYAGMHIASGKQVAIKVLDKAALKRADCVVQLRREVEVQSRLRHPNIVRILDYFHDKARAYVVLEFCSGGELYGKLQACPEQRMAESETQVVIACIASALRYCHKRHVLHRDVKPENILVDGTGTVKLADFGWSVHAPEPFSARKTLCGTPEYLAPELAKALAAVESGCGPVTGLHGSSVDMWALGCLAFELLAGATPFSEQAWLWAHPAAAEARRREAAPPSRLPRVARLAQAKAKPGAAAAASTELEMPGLTNRIRAGEWAMPPSLAVSEEAVEFVRGLVVRDPARRMTAAEACEHPWIKDHLPSEDGAAQRVSLAPTRRSWPKNMTPTAILSVALASAAATASTPSAAAAGVATSTGTSSASVSTRGLTPRDFNSAGGIEGAGKGLSRGISSAGRGPLSRARPRVHMGKAVRVAPGTAE